MKNEFKYIGVISSVFIGVIFTLGFFSNVKHGDLENGGIVGGIALFFFILAFLAYQRGKKKVDSVVKPVSKAPDGTILQLPAKQYSLEMMQGDAAKIANLIHLAIDQAEEGAYDATEVLLKQAENKIATLAHHESQPFMGKWKRDIQGIRAYVIGLKSEE
ncbi:MAG: hypothetical protein ACPGJS_11080 [Flammeovirgaceae bacterium]